MPMQDMLNVTDALLASGVDICTINSVRKYLSAVKGGARSWSDALQTLVSTGDPICSIDYRVLIFGHVYRLHCNKTVHVREVIV